MLHTQLKQEPVIDKICNSEMRMESKNTEIISITTIKPSLPTPLHLQTFKLSHLDQVAHHVYSNMTFFYSPSNGVSSNDTTDHNHPTDYYTNLFFSKSKLLKKSLSETLSVFYHLAGRLEDDSTITCNDEGVVFIESKADFFLSDILTCPDFDLIYSICVPTNYQAAMEMANGSFLLFNCLLFRCGSIAVSIAASHKMLDLASLMTFLKSLSAACCDHAQPIAPDLHTASSLFPSRKMPKANSPFTNLRKSSMKSFVFTASKVQELKTIAAKILKQEGYEFGYLSRVNVIMAFLWKCLVATFISQRGFFRPTVMIQAANLRNRIEPSIPQNAMGVLSFLFPISVEKESEVGMIELLKKLMELKVSVDGKAKRFKGEEVVQVLAEETKNIQDFFNEKDNLALYIGSSWCRFELYDIDFGFGKPFWMTSITTELLTNSINLMDTQEVGGVEALVYLDEQEMKAFECNQELLNFAVLKRNVT